MGDRSGRFGRPRLRLEGAVAGNANDVMPTTDREAEAGHCARRKIYLIAGGLVAVALAGVALVFGFVQEERARELQNWQVRLGIVADSRTAEVQRWISEQKQVLVGLTTNTSLQFYAMDMVAAGEDAAADADSAAMIEGEYLRNLLTVTADQAGFVPSRPQATIGANVSPSATGGLALLDSRGKTLIATPFMPLLPEGFSATLAQASEGQPAVYDVRPGPSGEPVIGFAAPLYGVQQTAEGAENIGYVVGLRPLGDAFFKLLEQPGDAVTTAETLLVRKRGSSVEYLTPLADGTGPLEKRLAADTDELAAAFAMAKPGGFAVKRNYAGTDVLVTGRAVAGTDWTLVRTVAADEALAASNQRLRTLLIVSLLVIAAVVIGAVALWRHGTSVRFAQAAARYRATAERLEHYMRFMRVVSDGQPTAIAAIDRDGRYTFANKQATWESGLTPEQVVGKTIAEVMGPHTARKFQDLNEQAIDRAESLSAVHTLDGDPPRIIKSEHIPLPADNDHPATALMVLEDLTEVMAERARRERSMRDLIGTLVSLVDRRDPYSAYHSARVAEVAKAIATEMDQPADVVQTVDIAGNLMNLGKILVPQKVLTKTGKLTPQELKIVRDSMIQTADLLGNVSFDLPVAETLRQLQERWDGGGYPDGLKGEQILVSARIVAVANAFVSMVSPRAFRGAMSFQQAATLLTADAGARYDRAPIAALVNYLENRGGREKWAHFAEMPTAGQAVDETAPSAD